jgi:Protein of unknown function (DUF4240)
MAIQDLKPAKDIQNAADADWFWAIIDATAPQAPGGVEQQDEQAEALEKALQTLSDQDLVDFIHLFAQVRTSMYSWRLWAAAYVLNGGCSDDGFYYFRHWLISCGRSIATKAMSDPDSLADLKIGKEEAEFEFFGYLMLQAYEARSGGKMPEFPQPAESEPSDPDWDFDFDDEDEMKKRQPRLSAKFLEA